ncbi:hypothetical protein ZIOFF_049043 [Zingiber officinale]|uniref:Uncharacterized protein n=1 Tax=Zingiber officinale TaxID=94328 RepID=A0A8J5FW68_ZINOF|nr:hypothetical protein ZIOFF_049043 [Zingiber officinale]
MLPAEAGFCQVMKIVYTVLTERAERPALPLWSSVLQRWSAALLCPAALLTCPAAPVCCSTDLPWSSALVCRSVDLLFRSADVVFRSSLPPCRPALPLCRLALSLSSVALQKPTPAGSMRLSAQVISTVSHEGSYRCCIACILLCGALDVVRVVHSTSRMEELGGAVTVGDVTRAYPGHVLRQAPDGAQATEVVTLPSDAELEKGKFYFLVPAAETAARWLRKGRRE